MKFIVIAVVLAQCVLQISCRCTSRDSLFKISVGHINDFHARYEEINNKSQACEGPTCIGGLARVYTVYNRVRDSENFIFLNAGDNFQGTLWYNLFKWNVTQYFMNMFEFDAFTLGNHEFDGTVAGLVPFIKSLKAPVVIANMDDSNDSSLWGTYNKSTIIWRGGKKIGVIGALVATTSTTSNTGKVKFFDEIESINKEAQRLVEEEDVFTNIVLSHCGYDLDKEIAANVGPKVSFIVGAHTHTLLYNGPTPSGDIPEGDYPTIIQNKNGDTVLIVQAFAHTKYFGNITLFYDNNGKVKHWEGKPIYLENNITPDPYILKELQPWKEYVQEYSGKVLGESLVELSNEGCFLGECLLGNVFTDAMIAAWQNYEDREEGAWTYAALAVMNAGAIKAPIPKGEITFKDIVTAQPHGNTFDCGDIQGKYIKQFLEFATKPFDNARSYADINILQVSGIKVVFDLTKPYGERVTFLQVMCQNCPTPVYEDVDDEKMYRIVTVNFLTNGGDGFVALSDNLQNLKIGTIDIDFYVDYFPKVSPINQTIEGRVKVIGGERLIQKIALN